MSAVDVWLRGPVVGIDPLLQPVAHALLQVLEDMETICTELDATLLWRKSGDAAAIGFHLLHIAGATDRLFTYARGDQLNQKQIAAMKTEKSITEQQPGADELIKGLRLAIQDALLQLRSFTPADLSRPREVGKAKLPSTVIGLLFHAAEHAQRHSGQVVTTTRILSKQ